MKGKKGIFIGILIGTFIGWGLSNLLMPFDVVRFSFLLGFVASLVLATLLIMAWFFWKRKPDGNNLAEKSKSLAWLLRSFFVILTGVLGSFIMIRQNDIHQSQKQFQQQQIIQQNLLMQSVRNSGMGDLMNNIFDKIDEELTNNPKRILSESTIDRAAALSSSLKPYGQLEGDSLSKRKLSPERGQLLLALVKMGLDSNSFNQIKSKGDFSGSDLMDADLKGANLRWAPLQEANFKGADLDKANLSEVNLWGANFWGAKLSDANLRGANLERSDLKWVDLNGADLRDVNLRGVDLSNARMNGVDLRGSDLKWSQLRNVSLKNANLSNVKMLGVDFTRSDFSDANMNEAYLKHAKFIEADLRKVNLNKAFLAGANFKGADLTEVDLRHTDLKKVTFSESNLDHVKISSKDLLKELEDWNAIGIDYIRNNYKIVTDTSKNGNYMFIPKNKK